MKRLSSSIFAAFIVIFFNACGGQNSVTEAQTVALPSRNADSSIADSRKTTVLVELFTSEGCSSCPPAERFLAKIEKEQPFENIDVITLALHVDYWDSLGWKDEFSSPLFTRRQDIYARALKSGQVYTPQMIVDGNTAFIGSKEDAARRAIVSNAKNAKANIEVSNRENTLSVNISNVPKHDQATVYLAITESNISTDVKAGENSGRRLEHAAIVRELRSIGMLSKDQSEFSYEQVIQILPNWKAENLKFVIFIQENQSRKILGASRAN